MEAVSSAPALGVRAQAKKAHVHFLHKKMCTPSWVRRERPVVAHGLRGPCETLLVVECTWSTLRDETFTESTLTRSSSGVGWFNPQLGQTSSRSPGNWRSNGFQICCWHE